MAISPGHKLNHGRVLRIPRLDMMNVKKRIITWNTQTLYAAGKLDNEVQEMRRCDYRDFIQYVIVFPGILCNKNLPLTV